MGNTPTPQQQALEAETDILSHGILWWNTLRTQRQFHSLPSTTTLTITRKVADTPCEEQSHTNPDPATMHSIKYTTSTTDDNATPLVVFPGFGSGTGIFYTTLPGLCEIHPGPVYVVDFLGCGLSTRRPWTLGYGADCNLTQAEDYFCEALETWRRNMGFTGMVLSGHSMGGYLCTAFCERYPESVERLVLISPVGVPEPEPGIKERLAHAPWYIRWGLNMWESGYSPMAIPGTWHWLGLHGKARYNDASWTSRELLRKYFYYNWCNGDPSAGARTHSTLLTPGAYARSPLMHRIPALRGKIPRISVIYGQHDWMTPRHFEEVKQNIVSSGGATCAWPIDVTRVADAGHNMMVDNPEGFLDAFWAIHNAALLDDSNVTNGMEDGLVFGQTAWMRERGVLDVMKVGLVVEGRSRNPRGTRADPYVWTKCTVLKDLGDGLFKVQWNEGSSKGSVSSSFGGHQLRVVEKKEAR